jgi:hypothetical protein
MELKLGTPVTTMRSWFDPDGTVKLMVGEQLAEEQLPVTVVC